MINTVFCYDLSMSEHQFSQDNSQEALRAELQDALDLSNKKLADPKDFETRYFGPSQSSSGIARALIWGIIGHFAGEAFGQLGSKRESLNGKANPHYRDIKKKTLGWFGASVGAIYGLYNGMKQARAYHNQVDQLQQKVVRMRNKHEDLQLELRHQVKARMGDSDASPKINGYDPSWDEKADIPQSEVAAESVKREIPIEEQRERF